MLPCIYGSATLAIVESNVCISIARMADAVIRPRCGTLVVSDMIGPGTFPSADAFLACPFWVCLFWACLFWACLAWAGRRTDRRRHVTVRLAGPFVVLG